MAHFSDQQDFQCSPYCCPATFNPALSFKAFTPGCPTLPCPVAHDLDVSRQKALFRAFTPTLPCLAAHDLDVSRQKALLRAAAYGRAFCGPSFPPLAMHTVAHQLRLLNALRHPSIGWPLTAAQLAALGVPAMLARQENACA